MTENNRRILDLYHHGADKSSLQCPFWNFKCLARNIFLFCLSIFYIHFKQMLTDKIYFKYSFYFPPCIHRYPLEIFHFIKNYPYNIFGITINNFIRMHLFIIFLVTQYESSLILIFFYICGILLSIQHISCDTYSYECYICHTLLFEGRYFFQ